LTFFGCSLDKEHFRLANVANLTVGVKSISIFTQYKKMGSNTGHKFLRCPDCMVTDHILMLSMINSYVTVLLGISLP